MESRLRGPARALLSLAVLAGAVAQGPAVLAASGVKQAHPGSTPKQSLSSPAPADKVADPQGVLPRGWRSSKDRMVTVAGDATGLHVLVADESAGYTWRTAATLTVTATDTTQWIGQACVTGNGQDAVVVYAPRQITNAAEAMGDGALAAVVNLTTGKVKPVGAGVSIAYFDPGCGTSQQAVLTQGGTGDGVDVSQADSTHLMTLDVTSGRITSNLAVPGEFTSAVPYDGQIAADHPAGVVTISPAGQVRTLVRTSGTAFDLTPDAGGGLGFAVADGHQVQLHRYAAGHDTMVGRAVLGSAELSQTGGRVFVTGPRASSIGHLPASWQAVNVPAGSHVSTAGQLAVTGTSTSLSSKGRSPLAASPASSLPVKISARVIGTGASAAFTVPPAAPAHFTPVPSALPGFPGAATGIIRPKAAPATGPAANAPAASTDPSTLTTDPDRTCAVARNDPKIETYQPSQQNVEWAVDQAVQGDLTNTRGPDVFGSGLPAYSPQGLFPRPSLDGGGTVPAQVMLGVLAQESNEDQASPHAIIGQTGNFQPSYNWYGDAGDYTYVDWPASDCGYGLAQVTTGMCMSGNTNCGGNTAAFPYDSQEAVAVDYEANIAAGLEILGQKWNQLYSLSITANGGASKYIENWWFALWAYNSGLEPSAANGNSTGCSPSPSCTDAAGNGSGGHWGLGWVNNPINPMYKPGREMFLSANYNTDEANPQNWSYEEKVIGFAAYGYVSYSFINSSWGQSFARGIWPGGQSTSPIGGEPPLSTFCTSDDNCTPSNTSAPCNLANDHCWWNAAVTWNNDPSQYFGTQALAYAAGSSNPGFPGVPSGYAPQCSSNLPASAVIVGDTASSIPSPYGCGESWSNNGGTMTWKFGSDGGSPATYPSKIDLHQIGSGYSGHFWFTHTLPSSSASPGGNQPPQAGNADLQITGTWTPSSSVKGWVRIMAAVPGEGAWDPQASYRINLGNGTTEYRVVNQGYQTDTWVSLGFFNLSSGASVSLSNVTYSGLGDDIAWDAMAFIPATPPATDYVAMGDSYSSAEGLSPYLPNSDYSYSGMQNTCHRSAAQSFPDLVTMPGQSTSIAQQAANPASGVQFAYTACSDALTPAITEKAVDQPASNPPASTWYSWDQAGYTDWTTGQEFFGGPSVVNALTGKNTASTSLEVPQADQGWLSPSTTLVTITQGGDDARFSSVMTGCVETDSVVSTDGNGCSGTNYYLTNNGVVDPQPLYKFEPQVISALPYHLEMAYSAIAAAAPDARIIVMGYPRLFPGDTSPSSACAVDAASDIIVPDEAMLNSFGDQLNSAISTAVSTEQAAGVNIDFIDPAPAFTGHEVCSSSPWINGVVNEESSNAGTTVPGFNSFHLQAAGQQEFATLVDQCLAGTLPSGDGTC